jgi:uncharacterized protein
MIRPVLTVPGIYNSGPGHWQSRWEQRHPGVTRVNQRDWDHAECEEWVATLDAAIAGCSVPPILAAHSLGCLTAAHWAARLTRPIYAALLVAVPDPDGAQFPTTASGFTPLPSILAIARVMIIASHNDPYASVDFSTRIAQLWGVAPRWLGNAGHINASSGLGDWDEAWALIDSWRREP